MSIQDQPSSYREQLAMPPAYPPLNLGNEWLEESRFHLPVGDGAAGKRE